VLSHLSFLLSSSLFQFHSSHYLFFFLMLRPPTSSTLFPYTTLFRSLLVPILDDHPLAAPGELVQLLAHRLVLNDVHEAHHPRHRSEEHTSELQSRGHLVCRLLLEKKKKSQTYRDKTIT